MLLAREHSAGSFSGMEERWGGGGTFLIQREKTLGARVRALPYFTEAKRAFLNLLISKDLRGLFDLSTSSQGVSGACGQALTSAPANCVGCCVCVLV